MAFEFPASPTTGQIYGNYMWDGEKWIITGSKSVGAVRYDTSQSLTPDQQAQARDNIDTISFTAFQDALNRITALEG